MFIHQWSDNDEIKLLKKLNKILRSVKCFSKRSGGVLYLLDAQT